MDEYGFVNDLDLAKSILIMYFSNKFILERELVTKIKNELVEIEGGFTFINPDGYYHFGGSRSNGRICNSGIRRMVKRIQGN